MAEEGWETKPDYMRVGNTTEKYEYGKLVCIIFSW